MTKAEKRMYESLLADTGDETKAMWFWLRWKCQTDTYFLATEIYELDRAKDRRGKKRLDPKLHKAMMRELDREEDTMQLYPRNHMKSTSVKYWIIKMILRNPNIRIGLFSITATLARKELKHIKVLMENPKLKELFPEIILDRSEWEKDTQDILCICRDPDLGTPPQEGQVECWGVGGSVTGHHYDYHVYDDIINEHSITSSEQIDKVKNWWQMVQVVKDVAAVEKIIGTRYHHQDIYGDILEEGHFEKKNIVQKAAIENGKPIYSFYTLRDLERLKKRMGNYNFSCQMMNNPVPVEDQMFLRPYKVWTELPKKRKYYITMDPAIGSRYSNKTGFCVACVDEIAPTCIYYVEATGLNEKPDKCASVLVQLIEKYRPVRVGIEYGLQEAIQYLIDLKLTELQKRKPDVLRPQFLAISTGKTKKADKINRTIGAMSREGRALFRPEKEMKALYRQMDMYNPNTDKNADDILDAAGMMVQTIEHFAQGYWSNVKPALGTGWTFEQLSHMGDPVKGWGSSFVA